MLKLYARRRTKQDDSRSHGPSAQVTWQNRLNKFSLHCWVLDSDLYLTWVRYPGIWWMPVWPSWGCTRLTYLLWPGLSGMEDRLPFPVSTDKTQVINTSLHKVFTVWSFKTDSLYSELAIRIFDRHHHTIFDIFAFIKRLFYIMGWEIKYTCTVKHCQQISLGISDLWTRIIHSDRKFTCRLVSYP